MKKIGLCSATWLFPFIVLAQTIQTSDHDACQNLILPYQTGPDRKAVDQDSLLHLEDPSGGALYFFGAAHSDDVTDPQFARIEEAFSYFRPTIVFYEGPERPLAATREETIRKYGESGYVRFLATQERIPIARLEPDPREEMHHVLQHFTPEQAALFYVLREAARLRDNKGLSKDEIQGAIAQLLERAAALGSFPFASIEDLEAAYQRTWNNPTAWWQAPKQWFDPQLSSEETGGIFTNDVNRASSEFRNLHMYRVITDAIREGHRVFAVVGRNHVMMQAPALRCAFSR